MQVSCVFQDDSLVFLFKAAVCVAETIITSRNLARTSLIQTDMSAFQVTGFY